MSILRPLVILAALVFSLIARGADKAAPADAKNLEGTWLPVKGEMRGTPLTPEIIKAVQYLKLADGKYELRAESPDKGTYAIDPTKSPKTMDIVGVEGPNAGKKLPAIYEVTGDTLRICYALGGAIARPTEFKTSTNAPLFLVVYTRKKD